MNIPSDLSLKIRQNKLIIFVGAGLSSGAGLPNWKELIIKILENIKEHEIKAQGFINVLTENLLEPVEVLKKIEHLQKPIIEAFEKEIRSYDGKEPTNSHRLIHEISTKIVTTNYDKLLEKCNIISEQFTYNNEYKISKMSEYSEYIFKIHGDIGEPDKCILFPSQYENLYSKEETIPVFQLKKIFSDNSILFIGFGLNDPYINYVLEYINKLYSGFNPDHYIITTEENKNWSNKIKPIFINSYNELDNLLIFLSKQKEQQVQEVVLDIKNLEKDEIVVGHPYELEYDIPPSIKYWVGRKKEIENISNENFKVICITGIGGQGKSALAAHYLLNKFNDKLYEFADWRDFKEETNRFQTKLISIVKRLTKEKFEQNKIEGLSNKELVDLFFALLGDRKIVFVFDNIDSYIDLELFIPIGDIGYLFKQALSKSHNSRFIFTCRPFIREASVNFYQISLSGLVFEESLELFEFYQINAKSKDVELLCKRAYSITKGHPLWLNLIAAQAIRGIDVANKFLDNIGNKSSFNEEDFSAILSQKVLTQVWLTLNPKQQSLLRGIAEIVKPETINTLKQILSSELNNKQFDRAFKTLKNLNLIEIKSSSISEDQIELHPLVREFILSKYQRKERVKYITLLVKYYDQFIYILKPKLSSDLPLSSFQNWTSKIELEINKGDFRPALVALQEVSDSILSAGYVEEFLRVSEKLFDSINWKEAIDNEYSYFHSQFQCITSTLSQFGKYEKADLLLNEYEKLIPGKSSYYLTYCSEKCYLYWYQEKFNEAIYFGEKGEFLLQNSGLTDNYSLRHNLALARRDSKIPNNLSLALKFFLNNEDIDSVVDINELREELGGSFYGNIGRCFEFLGEYRKALICYYKSIRILFNEKSEISIQNISYANYWISELLFKDNMLLDGLYFLRYAIVTSISISPPRASKYQDRWDSMICDIETKRQVENKADWQVEKYCKNNIDKFFGEHSV